MKSEFKFEDLFERGLETLYDAETQIVAALPKLMTAASSELLAGAFSAHLEATKNHVTRLETIFEQMGEEPRGRESEGLRGLLADGEALIGDLEKSSTLDVALATCARKVEHWEMVAYESLSGMAELVGQHDAFELLQETLDEESDADETLAQLADSILTGDATPDEEIEIDEEEEAGIEEF
jgi:ferritin-like metal-binding protein YciE